MGMMEELKVIYDKCTPAQKSVFADYVSAKLEGKSIVKTLEYGLLSDTSIKEIPNLITPFVAEKVKSEGVLSYGLEPNGYTFRLSSVICKYDELGFIDPKQTPKVFESSFNNFIMYEGEYYIVSSLETFKFPKDVCGLIYPKSSYSRRGIIMNFAPIEAGYEGTLTFSIFNSTSKPFKIYTNEGIAQVQFYRSKNTPEVSYQGRYSGGVKF